MSLRMTGSTTSASTATEFGFLGWAGIGTCMTKAQPKGMMSLGDRWVGRF